jgi:hypothetical protein
MVWIVFLMDALSPTFDLREAASWSAAQVMLFIAAVVMTAFAVGVAGPFGTCLATGVLDPTNRAPNRLNMLGPCDEASGVTSY